MKKLTAGILASLIGLVSANSAEAAVASTSYVDGAIGTKQDTLTPTNFIAPAETGDFISGFTVNNGTVTFTSGKLPDAATVDEVLSQTSTNAIQNQAVAKKIAGMAATVPTDAENKVVKSVTQADGTVTASYAQVTGADIAAETIQSANIADGTIATGDIANNAVTSDKILDGTIATGDIADSAVTSAKILDGTIATADIANAAVTSEKIASVTMTQVEGLDTALNAKQAKLTTDNQGDNVQLSFDAQGNLLKISATDTTYETATANAAGLTKLYAETGAATDGTMTQAAITTELGKKQVDLTAGNGITLDDAGNIAAKAGTGITIDANGINANNQLDAVTGTGDTGLQVLTRDCSTGTCVYVWEEIDRTFNAQ